MKFTIILLLLIFASGASAQKTLSGVVLNKKGMPVPSASVFILNTSVGTTTDSVGQFVFNSPFQMRIDLVVSSIGYESFTKTIMPADSLINEKIILKEHSAELEKVIVHAYEKDGWKKYGDIFNYYVLGVHGTNTDCRVKNPEVIRFVNDKTTGQLTAYAFEPLQIENNKLGYDITYNLDVFIFDKPNATVTFGGFPFYTEKKGSEKKMKVWKTNRETAYRGSVMHFMRSVYLNKLNEEKFTVQRVIKYEYTDKKRVKKIIKEIDSGKEIGYSEDSLAYFRNVMSGPDSVEYTYPDILKIDQMAFAYDSLTAGISFKGRLKVTYGDVNSGASKHTFSSMISYISLRNERPIEIYSNGAYYEPYDLYVDGYWSYSEKIVRQLPGDYKPEEK